MDEYIAKTALYGEVAKLEELARNRYLETPIISPAYTRYTAQMQDMTAFKHLIADFPAADVEPVVRCRECKHHYWVQEPCHGKSVHYCKLPHMSGVEVFKEFFCYYGERKEGADNV